MGDITPSWNPSADRRRNKRFADLAYGRGSSAWNPEPEKSTHGPLDDFIVPENVTEETCAKCHTAPANEAWNIFCAECTRQGLFG